MLQPGLLLSSLQLKGKKKKGTTIQPCTCSGLVTSRNAIIVLKPGSQAMNRRLYCPLAAWSLIATALKYGFLKEYEKLPHKVGSNLYIHNYLLIIDSRCYENKEERAQNASSSGIPRETSGLHQKLQINHFPPLPASAGTRASHTGPRAPGGMSVWLLPTRHQLSASAEAPSVQQPPQGPCLL